MKKRNNLIFGMAFLILLSSCSPQNFVYWKNIQSEAKCLENERYEAIIQKDDRLSIQVSSKNPELAIPFNRQGGTFYLTEDGTVSASSEGTATVREKGYRVDVDGNIEFPILGKLHVGGLTLNEATEMIQQKIKEGNYIKSPLVSIEILNFKYTVLGAVGNTGTFRVDGDRVTLVDAIANAGDLASNARVDRIQVIRTVNGERKVFVHDFGDESLFYSPAFYLQQNDIVRRTQVPEEEQRRPRFPIWNAAAFAGYHDLLDSMGHQIIRIFIICKIYESNEHIYSSRKRTGA